MKNTFVIRICQRDNKTGSYRHQRTKSFTVSTNVSLEKLYKFTLRTIENMIVSGISTQINLRKKVSQEHFKKNNSTFKEMKQFVEGENAQ